MSWTLRCLKKTCDKVFNASSADARCPKCRGARTRWIPGGVAVISRAPGADRALKALAGDYGMSNIPTAERGMGSKRLATPAQTMKFTAPNASNWSIDVPVSAQGVPQAACAPTGETVRFRPGEGIKGRVNLPGPKPVYEGHHRPTGGAK